MNKDFAKEFLLGVNYWPRHHGIKMWQEFDLGEIDKEFAQIKAMGMNTVRIFPLWNDFQPIEEIFSYKANFEGLGMRGNLDISPDDNPEMMHEGMLKKFEAVVGVAEKYKLKLIVALMTTWMSGTLFDLSWRNGRNFFSDPFMIKWAMLYARAFGRRFKNNDTILFWEFGNEQNCVMECRDADTAWVWMQAIANELRLQDPNTPISSGMHGLTEHSGRAPASAWGIKDSGGILDVMTTHPYPSFTPGCHLDRLTSIRANIHASVEGRYYSGLSGKPVLCEETGSLGESILSQSSCADFAKLRLYSLLANGNMGCIWWCYSDFTCGGQLPYRSVHMENNGLGLTSVEGKVKPAGAEFGKFRKVLDELGGGLPPTECRTAIIVQDFDVQWEFFFNAYVLCKQAGIEAEFVYANADLEDYQLLICPSLSNCRNYDVRNWLRIVKEVKEYGKTLYVSWDGGSFTKQEELFGIEGGFDKVPFSHENLKLTANAEAPGILADVAVNTGESQEWFPVIANCHGKILLEDNKANPVLIEHQYGKGKAVFCALGVEKILSGKRYAYDDDNSHLVYEYLRDLSKVEQKVWVKGAQLEKTWHQNSADTGYLTVINYAEKTTKCEIISKRSVADVTKIGVSDECRISKTSGWELSLSPLSAAIFKVDIK